VRAVILDATYALIIGFVGDWVLAGGQRVEGGDRLIRLGIGEQVRVDLGRHRAVGDAGQQGRRHAPNAMDNFCFEVTLSYRRLEPPRRAQ
jgi:hypothetical protein